MTTYLDDTFTGAAGTLLTAHAPDTGSAYSGIGTTSQVPQLSGAGRAMKTGAGGGKAATPTLAAADVRTAITLDFLSLLTADFISISVRQGPSTSNFYQVQMAQDGILRLGKNVSGTLTNFAGKSYNTGAVAGSTHELALECVGSTIRVLWDGAEVISQVDTDFPSAGRCALSVGNSSSTAQTDSTGIQPTRWVVSDPVVAAPTFTTAPAISGTPAVGQSLACDGGTVSGSGVTKTYQWKRDGTAIVGATASTYTVVSGDAGHALTCTVTATNGGGNVSSTSNSLSVPAAPVFTAAPVVTTDGTPATGETISCSNGTVTGTGVTYAKQWFRGASPLTGQTGDTYTLTVSDEGANITCMVTATNGGGSASASSNTIVPATTTAISDASFLTYLSGGTDNTSGDASIGGARGGTYLGSLGALISAIAGSVAQAGGTFYRVLYVRNTHSSATAASCRAFITQQFARSGLQLAVGVPTEGAGQTVPALASGTTAPSGITFSSPADYASGVAFGDLGPGQQRGIYVRVTIAAGTTSSTEDDAAFRVEGTAS